MAYNNKDTCHSGSTPIEGWGSAPSVLINRAVADWHFAGSCGRGKWQTLLWPHFKVIESYSVTSNFLQPFLFSQGRNFSQGCSSNFLSWWELKPSFCCFREILNVMSTNETLDFSMPLINPHVHKRHHFLLSCLCQKTRHQPCFSLSYSCCIQPKCKRCWFNFQNSFRICLLSPYPLYPFVLV